MFVGELAPVPFLVTWRLPAEFSRGLIHGEVPLRAHALRSTRWIANKDKKNAQGQRKTNACSQASLIFTVPVKGRLGCRGRTRRASATKNPGERGIG